MEIKTSKEIRLLLVGKTGSGKSSVGNQLIGSKVFKVGRTCKTTESQLERRTLQDGSELVVVNTPGYCNVHLTEDGTEKEINRGMELLAPGPHCIIIVFSLSERVTGDDIKRLQNLQSQFAMYLKHVLVVFTGLDHLEDEGQTLDQYIKRLPQQLHDFLNRLEAPPLGVNTRHHTDINSSSQIIEAIKQIYDNHNDIFIENPTIRKRKGGKSWISVEESKLARKDNEPFTDKRTVLLLGKSGVGKSSVGNVLLGEKKFSTSMFEENGTKTCQIGESDQLIVIDTPGFFSSINSDVDTVNDIISTIKGRLTSIHVFILVLSVDARFAGYEDKALEFIRSLFGGEIPDQLMYAFTRKDSLEDDDWIIPPNLPDRPYRILNCKPNSQKDREDLLREIVSFNNPISSNKIGDANLDHIAKAEIRRKEASKVDLEAYGNALTRLGHDTPKSYREHICEWVSSWFP